MPQAVTPERTPVEHIIISHLHCLCNVIANMFGYEFHVSVKLDRSKKFKIEVVEIEIPEPQLVEHIVIPDEDLVVPNSDVISEITL